MTQKKSIHHGNCSLTRQLKSFRKCTSRLERLEPRVVLDSTLVFNEIMYHPADDQNGFEWVELYNQLSINLDVSRWRLDGVIEFTFPEGTIAPGGSYLVVASNPLELATQSGFPDSLGPLSGQLSNTGEEIRLLNNNVRVMGRIAYNDTGDWPVGPDGSGFTLVKSNLLTPNGPPEN